ncbi:hypothetical protein LWI29_000842 [Acer saccharum]|uniref:Uncharacterized protein n=1 Tax=Acer saccharum TaxID=4024 RepID=A0AA39W1J9_ACESA|nr:hypothetical protein LWI29_000842 [Acer saccharum]
MPSEMEERLLGSEAKENGDLKWRVWRESKKLWRIALPAMLARVTQYGMFVITQGFIGHIGEVDLAAYALIQIIAIRFANGILLGMSSATETHAGKHLGKAIPYACKLDLGIPGAMGSMISSWFIVFGEFVYLFGGWCPNTWTGFSTSAFVDLLPVLKLSISSGVMLCLELWYTAILVLLAGYMKNATVEISAFSICLNIIAWQFMLCFGFLAASSVRVANELGRGDAKAAKFSIKVAIKAVTSLSLLLSLTVFYTVSRQFSQGWLLVLGIWIGMLLGTVMQVLVLAYVTWKTNWNEQVNKASERLNKWLLTPSEEPTGTRIQEG